MGARNRHQKPVKQRDCEFGLNACTAAHKTVFYFRFVCPQIVGMCNTKWVAGALRRYKHAVRYFDLRRIYFTPSPISIPGMFIAIIRLLVRVFTRKIGHLPNSKIHSIQATDKHYHCMPGMNSTTITNVVSFSDFVVTFVRATIQFYAPLNRRHQPRKPCTSVY